VRLAADSEREEDVRARIGRAAAKSAAQKAAAAQLQTMPDKIVTGLSPADLGDGSLSITLSVANGKVTGQISRRKSGSGNGPATTWTDDKKQELADLLRSGLSKPKAAEKMGVSASSVSNTIYSNGRNLAGFLAKYPKQ